MDHESPEIRSALKKLVKDGIDIFFLFGKGEFTPDELVDEVNSTWFTLWKDLRAAGYFYHDLDPSDLITFTPIKQVEEMAQRVRDGGSRIDNYFCVNQTWTMITIHDIIEEEHHKHAGTQIKKHEASKRLKAARKAKKDYLKEHDKIQVLVGKERRVALKQASQKYIQGVVAAGFSSLQDFDEANTLEPEE